MCRASPATPPGNTPSLIVNTCKTLSTNCNAGHDQHQEVPCAALLLREGRQARVCLCQASHHAHAGTLYQVCLVYASHRAAPSHCTFVEFRWPLPSLARLSSVHPQTFHGIPLSSSSSLSSPTQG
ncbi:hypothetical protein E2C01_068141 [Portunus trituberculatus]|uniref:Uncharacterized protein n=1 Tax=Portunus trituberculatus TaxID=210409 RepID=A0A5B7HV02_PORTR|nr:hypothetical protein [Portunus trituberculatus]